MKIWKGGRPVGRSWGIPSLPLSLKVSRDKCMPCSMAGCPSKLRDPHLTAPSPHATSPSIGSKSCRARMPRHPQLDLKAAEFLRSLQSQEHSHGVPTWSPVHGVLTLILYSPLLLLVLHALCQGVSDLCQYQAVLDLCQGVSAL